MSTLCLNMIVKNEEKNLPACLNSVKGVVDEVVIVDTGSTDSTVEIAKSYGAEVFQFPWTNNFSEARNYALSKVRSNWILYLDADEQLDSASVKTLKSIINENKNLGIRCKIFSEDTVSNKPKLQSYTRLFKNASEIKFTGKVHEQIDDSLIRQNYQIINSDILINHSGYNLSADKKNEKAKRNLELLQSEYEEKPSGYSAFQLGNTYSILDDKENAYKYYNIASGDQKLPNEYRSLSLSYCAEYQLHNQKESDAIDTIVEAVKLDPDNIITNLIASEIFFSQKQMDQAVHYCMKALDENEKRSSIKSGNRLIDVFHENEKIIYHGLHITFASNHRDGIEYFFNKLQLLKEKNSVMWQKELEIIQCLSTGDDLSDAQYEAATNMITENSLEFYNNLLKGSQNENLKINLMKCLVEKFPDNPKLKNQYGLYMKDNNQVEEAITEFKEAMELNPDNQSTVFYLISLFLEQQNFSELDKLIEESKVKFAQNKNFIQQLTNLEIKISSLKQNTN